MTRRVKARPTVYAGVQYRSRLEATWAAFFDLAGIKVWYEGREDLNGWIPDFEIAERQLGCDQLRCLVEVKPAHGFADLLVAAEKAKRSGYVGYVYLLGVDPSVSELVYVEPNYVKFYGPAACWRGGVDAAALWAAAQNATQWRPPT